ncbi:MAG TPA: hypothetical protein VMX94_10795 [Armatimonadota bacterium]|nr:hypothetical protein [Armatimonadota bacterium]
MRRTRPRNRFWLVVAALVIVPPLGLFMLWKSPWSRLAKVVVSALCVLLIAGAVVGAARIHNRWSGKKIPECGYDLTMDSRNRYRTPDILPLEREVFNAVVREMRRPQIISPINAYSAEGPNLSQPQTRAFAIVAERHNLDPDVVAAIYRKVSSHLAPRGR